MSLQGQALAALGIEKDLMLLLYTMIDRHDKDSDFAPFWASLPERFMTGELPSPPLHSRMQHLA